MQRSSRWVEEGTQYQTWDLLEALSTYIARFWAHAYGSWILTYTRSRALVLLERTLRHISESGGKSCEMLGCPLSIRFVFFWKTFLYYICIALPIMYYSIFSLSNTHTLDWLSIAVLSLNIQGKLVYGWVEHNWSKYIELKMGEYCSACWNSHTIIRKKCNMFLLSTKSEIFTCI